MYYVYIRDILDTHVFSLSNGIVLAVMQAGKACHQEKSPQKIMGYKGFMISRLLILILWNDKGREG